MGQEACRSFLQTRLELAHEDENPRIASERASALRLRDEEQKAANYLVSLDEDLDAAQSSLTMHSAQDLQAQQVSAANDQLVKARQRCDDLLTTADKAGVELASGATPMPTPPAVEKAAATPMSTPPAVEKMPAALPAKAPANGDFNIEDLEKSLLSIVKGNDALEQRIRGGTSSGD